MASCATFKTTVLALRSCNFYSCFQAKAQPTSLSISPNGELFALTSTDFKVRIYQYLSGKTLRTYDESYDALNEMQKDGDAAYRLEAFDFGRRNITTHFAHRHSLGGPFALFTVARLLRKLRVTHGLCTPTFAREYAAASTAIIATYWSCGLWHTCGGSNTAGEWLSSESIVLQSARHPPTSALIARPA